jgi:hypothetical protein
MGCCGAVAGAARFGHIEKPRLQGFFRSRPVSGFFQGVVPKADEPFEGMAQNLSQESSLWLDVPETYVAATRMLTDKKVTRRLKAT